MSYQRPPSPKSEAAEPNAATPPARPDLPLGGASDQRPGAAFDVTIVIPLNSGTRDMGRVVRRLDQALPGIAVETVFVAESDEHPGAAVAASALPTGHTRLSRHAGGGRGGPGAAVLAAMRHAHGRWVVVLDDERVHSPEAVSAMLRAGATSGADVVVASRYRLGGGRSGPGGGRYRRAASPGTAMVRCAFPHRLGGVTDPMSGFFAVRRAALDGVELSPSRTTMLLEILLNAGIRNVAEVTYTPRPQTMAARTARLRDGLRLLGRLVLLRLTTLVTPSSGPARFAGFAAAGGSGIGVNSAALWLLAERLGLPYLLAAFVAVQLAIGWNFVLVDRFAMPRTDRTWLSRFGRFWLVNNSSVPVHLGLLYALVRGVHLHYLAANLVAIAAVFVGRYLLTRRWVYGSTDTAPPAAVRRFVTAIRRAPQIRIALAFLLALIAVPTTLATAWNGLWIRETAVPLVIPLGAAVALMAARMRPHAAEPDVHDRQVDGLIAAMLLSAAGVLGTMEHDIHQTSSGWLLVATVAYLAGAMTLLLGTRAAARLRWVLVLPLVSADGVLPADVVSAANGVVRVGVAVLTQTVDGRFEPNSLTFWHHEQLLTLPASALPGVEVAGAFTSVALAALSCFGLGVRLLVRLASGAAVLAGVAVLCLASAMLIGRLFGAQPLRVALLPAITDIALAASAAALVWRWSRPTASEPTPQPRYLPRGRVAAVALLITAAALGLRMAPDLPIVRPHVPFATLVNADGSVHLVPVGQRR